MSADVVLKMTTILKERRIAQLCSKSKRTLINIYRYELFRETNLKKKHSVDLRDRERTPANERVDVGTSICHHNGLIDGCLHLTGDV